MPEGDLARRSRIDTKKFHDPDFTADGTRRAGVTLERLKTLWFNTGTLCNIECKNCYIESSPKNDRLAYLSVAEVRNYLDQIAADDLAVEEIGFTGGEPFMNPDIIAMINESLDRGFRVLVLTNAMLPMWHKRDALLDIKQRHGQSLTVRVSMDHYVQRDHEAIRGPRTWDPMIKGLTWLAANGFNLAVAGRTLWGEDDDAERAGYAALFAELGVSVDASDPAALVLFPEMDATVDGPEITVACWGILGVDPASVMCATSRMVIKRKGAALPLVVPCTLLPDDAQFELGHRLADAAATVKLNHPHCAKFCVLGGALCSA
ncbi:MAG: radical SAM protein [Rhodospirillales bacterium]|jgi:uncharacterized Fe-S cluster-containing radical SAM superfamily protein|nr:radical SAM protein [Rhodospirillales bacterium]